MKELTGSDYIVFGYLVPQSCGRGFQEQNTEFVRKFYPLTIRTLAERYIMPEDLLPEVKRISQEQHHLIYKAISD
jgi:hypothetical protein